MYSVAAYSHRLGSSTSAKTFSPPHRSVTVMLRDGPFQHRSPELNTIVLGSLSSSAFMVPSLVVSCLASPNGHTSYLYVSIFAT